MHKSGFTLVELIVVIVILGVLSVTALPRFVDFSADAKRVSLQGLQGALKSANQLIYAKASVQGLLDEQSATVTLEDGSTVATQYGYLGYDSSSPSSGALQMESLINFNLCHHLANASTCPDGEWLFDIDGSNIKFYHISVGFSPAVNNGGTEPLCYLQYELPATEDDVPTYTLQSSEC